MRWEPGPYFGLPPFKAHFISPWKPITLNNAIKTLKERMKDVHRGGEEKKKKKGSRKKLFDRMVEIHSISFGVHPSVKQILCRLINGNETWWTRWEIWELLGDPCMRLEMREDLCKLIYSLWVSLQDFFYSLFLPESPCRETADPVKADGGAVRDLSGVECEAASTWRCVRAENPGALASGEHRISIQQQRENWASRMV